MSELSLAVFAAKTHKVTRLIAKGADPNEINEGVPVLVWAASCGHVDVVKALTAAGADVNARSEDGKTALHKSASYGHVNVVKALIAAGADVNARSKDGDTALHSAASMDHPEVVAALIAAGADAAAENKNRSSPFTYARAYSRVQEMIKAARTSQAAQSAQARARNLLRWQQSGAPREWVDDHHGQWNHSDWLELLEGLKRADFWPMDTDAIGRVLEEQKKAKSMPMEEGLKPAAGRMLKEQYELLGEVGRGGFGAVYKARDVHLDQFVAVKELILEDPAPFKEEAKALSELRHINIVGFRQLFPDQHRWYMVMDYVEGGSLAQLISDRTLYEGGADITLKRMLAISQQAAEGLNCAHDHGIIHQDVKPANVMVDSKGAAKVSDFGLAKARPQSAGYLPPGGKESIMVSANGMTPAYCSPEQAGGRKLTTKTDTWSWGLSVLEMFVGEVTWRSGTAAREALQRCRTSQSIRKDIPPLPQALTNLLERCFQDEPKARPDMGEIVAILADIQGVGRGNWLKRFLK